MLGLFLLLPFTILLANGAEPSPFESCQAVTLVSEASYAKDQSSWDKKFSECKDDSLQLLPTQSFLALNYNEGKKPNLIQSLSAIEFLSAIGERTVANIEKNIAELKVLEQCLKQKSVSANCDKLITDIRELMKANAPKVRSELSFLGQVSIGEADRALKTLKADHLVDQALKNSGGMVGGGLPQAPFSPLTKVEADASAKTWNNNLEAIRKEWNQKVSKEVLTELTQQGFKRDDERFKRLFQASVREKEKSYLSWGRSKIQEFQNEHRREYFRTAGRPPLLLHIADPNAKNEEIAAAIPHLLKSAQDELARSKKALGSNRIDFQRLNQKGGQRSLDDLLYFLGNGPVIESYLKDNRKGCATATGLMNFLSQDRSRSQTMLFAALLGGGALLPARLPLALSTIGISVAGTTVGTIFGAGTGIFMQLEAREDANLAEARFNAGVGSLKDMADAKFSKEIQIVLHPLDYIGAGAMLGKASSMARRTKEVAAMKKAGLDEKSIHTLVTHADSSDTTYALAAQREMAKYGWKEIIGVKPSDKDLSLLTKLINGGAVWEKDKKLKVAETLKLLTQMSDPEKFAIDQMIRNSPTGTRALLYLRAEVAGKPGDPEKLFRARLEGYGFSDDVAQKMCLCAGVCKPKAALNCDLTKEPWI